MVMNKREKQALADAEQAARVNQALRWSMPAHWREDYVSADLPPPEGYRGEHTLGWNFNLHRLLQAYGGARVDDAVYPAWSSGSTHGTGHDHPGRNGSQQACTLFTTKVRALRALRCALEQWAAERLHAMDVAIAAAEAADHG